MKNIILLLTLFFSLSFFSCEKEDDFGNENFNEIIVGAWMINETSDSAEVIEFYEEGYFLLNDSIFGNYWVNEDNIREMKYICDDEEDVSTMKLVRYIGGNNSIIINNLPKHEGDSHLVKIE